MRAQIPRIYGHPESLAPTYSSTPTAHRGKLLIQVGSLPNCSRELHIGIAVKVPHHDEQ